MVPHLRRRHQQKASPSTDAAQDVVIGQHSTQPRSSIAVHQLVTHAERICVKPLTEEWRP